MYRFYSVVVLQGHKYLKSRNRVKSGKFGYQVNSDTRLQIVEIQIRSDFSLFA